MAVYRWIYANAKMEGDRKDYHIRLCDNGLKEYQKMLIGLSNRLLSADKRRGKAERQLCWFGGYLDKKMYVIALGGDQRDLLGIEPDSYRAQHCVLAYGLTEHDICLYKREEALFEPLKKIMHEVQISGRNYVPDDKAEVTGKELLKYVQTSKADLQKADFNITKSTEYTDEKLWQQSLNYPVMTGIISKEDAQKLLGYFPDGAATVLEDVSIQYELHADTNAKNQTAAFKQQPRREKELERLKQAEADAQKQLAEIRAEKRRKEGQRKRAAVLFFLLLFFVLAIWFLA